jgi:hypothetical protein
MANEIGPCAGAADRADAGPAGEVVPLSPDEWREAMLSTVELRP